MIVGLTTMYFHADRNGSQDPIYFVVFGANIVIRFFVHAHVDHGAARSLWTDVSNVPFLSVKVPIHLGNAI